MLKFLHTADIQLNSPSIFPFRLAHISAEQIAPLSPRLDILRHGLDENMLMLHQGSKKEK